MSKVFLSYRRDEPDQSVVAFIQRHLAHAGHNVFRDVDIPVGTRWAEEIQRQLSEADVFVVLLSEQSMDRDMVREEVQQVYGQYRKTKKPLILPVRLRYRGALPYDMNAWLGPFQYALWDGPEDNLSIAEQLEATISGRAALPHEGSKATSEQQEELRTATETRGQPLPKAEPILDVIGMTANNPFYIQRAVDALFIKSLANAQGVATLHAPRQMGKSSLLARTRQQLHRLQLKSVFLDLKILATEPLNDAREAMLGLARLIIDQSNLTLDPESFFVGKGFAAMQLKKFLLAAFGSEPQRTVLLFDDIDSLFGKPYSDGLFGGLRVIIDQKATVAGLRNIGFGFAHSHDPSNWIKDSNQSPFNVAISYTLPEFSKVELGWLNDRHDGVLSGSQLAEILRSFGGHPYLTRVALYRLAKNEMTFSELMKQAAMDDGPFADHLRSLLLRLLHSGLAKSFKNIVDSGRCDNPLHYQSLLAMGMVKGSSHRAGEPRYGLYQTYFKGRLNG